jgi:hypothetical protein
MENDIDFFCAGDTIISAFSASPSMGSTSEPRRILQRAGEYMLLESARNRKPRLALNSGE